jgi:HEAT repeat protein
MKPNFRILLRLFPIALILGCARGDESEQQLAKALDKSSPQRFTAYRPEDEAPPLSIRPLIPIAEPYIQVWTVKETASDALGRMGEAAVPALVEALHNADPEVREQAGRALALIGPKATAAVPELILLLDDDSEPVRRQAARALGQIGPAAQAAIPALIKQLERKDPPTQSSPQQPSLPPLRRPQANRG